PPALVVPPQLPGEPCPSFSFLPRLSEAPAVQRSHAALQGSTTSLPGGPTSNQTVGPLQVDY
ncbi:hypothetical protein AMECASPLE_035804, partial [Ameca splendens]